MQFTLIFDTAGALSSGPRAATVSSSSLSSFNTVTATFEVELAPIQWMPHAVHLFLEQAFHGLWNNSLFHLNEPHVLQVGPSSREHRDAFRHHELDRLAFPEYSEEYPHHRWTLGYTGRPGGPSWYINKVGGENERASNTVIQIGTWHESWILLCKFSQKYKLLFFRSMHSATIESITVHMGRNITHCRSLLTRVLGR